MSYDQIRKEGRFLDIKYGALSGENRLAQELWSWRGRLYRVPLRICIFGIIPTTQEIWGKIDPKSIGENN